ncbi:DNA/RNA helicase domain-containing protein [Solibaculum mannosilyticum]|uniref:DNA/RNA helicase domain-containing protein n=1 Tax=Solibaculum mannosilyticum TaxID=2780922 RepID=UPI0034B1794C
MASRKYRTLTIEIKDGKLDQTALTGEQMDLLERKPVVYIYYNKNVLYVGETSGFLGRHEEHLKETGTDYRQFTHVIVLFGQYVDRNSQLDLERQLITYLITERETRLGTKIGGCLNRQLWRRVPDYRTKEEVYSQVLVPFWTNELKEAGIIEEVLLDNLRQSILFKYSPFQELSEEQLDLIDEMTSNEKNYLVEGIAGTGKTAVLTNLVARLCTDERYRGKKIGVAVKSNWINQAQRIFKAYGIQEHVSLGSACQLIQRGEEFDIIVVDEAHRLQRKYSKQHPSVSRTFKGSPLKTELDFLGRISKRMILLYDNLQIIRPSDIPWRTFEDYGKQHGFERRMVMKQFRIQIHEKGASYTAEDYFAGIFSFLQLSDMPFDKDVFCSKAPDAYFGLADSICELFDYVEERRQYHPTAQCRVLAGYARPWGSKFKPGHKRYTEFDWIEGEERWKWNSTNKNWIGRPGSEEEIGCVHAIQGIDLDYAGVIIAKDLTFADGKVTAVKEHYYDRNGIPAKKDFVHEDFTQYIKQIYYILLSRGIHGVRVYFEDEALKRHFMEVVGLS